MSVLSVVRKPFRYTFANATLWIIVLNVLAYFLSRFTPLAGYDGYFALSVRGFLGYHMVWQPFTYMFVHANVQHLFFNMLGLLFFGISVEKALGTKEFVLMYLVCGVLCGLASVGVYFLTGAYGVMLVGASGAIYALLLAYAVIFPRSRIFIWGILPVPAPIMVILYAVIELASQLFTYSPVAHLTHLAGFAFAWLYFRVRMGIRPSQVWKDAYR